MDDDLPNEFDLIVVGTGFTESIVAAAACRIGKNVLHMDSNDFYGGYWASHNLENVLQINEESQDKKPLNLELINNSLKINATNNYVLQNVRKSWYPFASEEELQEHPNEDWTKEKIMKEFRKFNIDISPKLLFARGDLVELLISSNICRYAEFRAVDRVASFLDDIIKPVPCSRSDVFTTKDISVVEKRLLMKFLTNCMKYDKESSDFQEYENKTFQNYLDDNQLTDNLKHYLLYSISMSNETTLFPEGITATKKFLSSLGRYGNTPFLFPMYGCGEIPQCFCRLCAVFGGIYCLKRSVSEINFTNVDNSLRFQSIQCGQQRIKANNIVFGHGSISTNIFKKDPDAKPCGNLSRAIILLDTPLGDAEMNSGGGGVIFLKMPSPKQASSGCAFVMQLSHYSGTCPKGLYLIHVTCDAEDYIDNYLDKLLKDYDSIDSHSASTSNEESSTTKPKILWSLKFNLPSCLKCNKETQTNDTNNYLGVHLTCGPYFELDYDLSIKEAKSIFLKLYPEDEFLPRAPDPEEIIIGDVDENLIQNIENVAIQDDAPNTEQTVDEIVSNHYTSDLQDNDYAE